MKSRTLLMVTGNEEKLEAAKQVFSDSEITIERSDFHCLEIQEDNVEEIAKWSARYASDMLQTDVIKTDAGFFIEELGGFPGPYAAYVEKLIPASKILSLLEGNENRKAVYREAIAYCPYKGQPIVFMNITPGRISYTETGEYGYNYDHIFIPDGELRTIANKKIFSERVHLYNNDGWKALREYLRSQD